MVDKTDSDRVMTGSYKRVNLPSLTANTEYFGKRWCSSGTQVDVFKFTTAATAPTWRVERDGSKYSAVDVQLQSGTTSALDTNTVVSCSSRCSVAVPSTHLFYRVVFRGGGGTTLFTGPIRRVAQ